MPKNIRYKQPLSCIIYKTGVDSVGAWVWAPNEISLRFVMFSTETFELYAMTQLFRELR